MAAPSNTAVPAAAAPGPSQTASDARVSVYVQEALWGGAAVMQDAPFAISSEAAGVLSEVPVLGIVCKAYLTIEELVSTAKSNKEDLAYLRDLFDGEIKKLLKKRKSRRGFLDQEFSKLQTLVLKAEGVAALCNGDRCRDKMKRAILARKISKDIGAIKSDIQLFCSTIGFVLNDATYENVSKVQENVSKLVDGRSREEDKRKASRFKIPPEAPRLHDWHVERKPLVAEACSLLGVGQSGDAPRKPRRVGLAGPGGAGKSTVASMVIIRADVRAYFEDGVLWLQVGQGAKERLLELKSRLADMVYETVKQKTCRGRRKKKNGDPEDEDGVEYIAHVMPKGKLRFLVVADDVWDVEVLQVLERTGAWVLYTTRENDLAPETPLRLDQVREEEAELLLRRAADVNDDADLPPAAYDLMKRCEFAALDLVFVGRWSDVRGRRENVEQAWRKVLNRIEDAQRRGQDVKLLSWRAAMLRAGLDELAGDNPKNKKLYLSLAVIPKGLAFPPEVAAVLLYGSEFSTGDLEAAETIVVTLERWSVLTLDDGGRYRIHDEHSDFIRDRGTANKGVLDSVLPQWREYMSSKRALLAFSGDWLDEIWKVLDRVDGAEAVVGKFDAALKEMGSSDPELEKALHNAAEFHGRRKEYMKEHSKSLRLLDVQERKGEGSSSDMDWTLNALGVSAGKAGRMDEAEQYFRPALAIWEDKQGLDRPDMEWTLNALGARAGTSGETEKAEELTRQALAVIQEDRLSVDHLDEDKVLKNLGLCARKAGKTKEAKELFRRALSIRKAKLGTDYPDAAVGDIIHNLAVCADMAGRKEAAEDLYRQAAAIRKNHLGKHPAVSSTLYNLALCVLSMGRTKEAEDIYRQALATCPLGIDRPDMASTL